MAISLTYSLVGIVSSSGTPIFSPPMNTTEQQISIDAFVSQQTELETDLPVPFSNDILIFKNYASDDDHLGVQFTAQADEGVSYYSAYYRGSTESIEMMLQHNYNMTTGAVEQVFTNIFNGITQELSPPKSSRTFAYDFKFSQNQNGSITTGSVRPVRTRAARSSGGGGY